MPPKLTLPPKDFCGETKAEILELSREWKNQRTKLFGQRPDGTLYLLPERKYGGSVTAKPLDEGEISFLIYCAIVPIPFLWLCPGPSPVSIDGLREKPYPQDYAMKFAMAFANHPDECGSLWQWVRKEREKKANTKASLGVSVIEAFRRGEYKGEEFSALSIAYQTGKLYGANELGQLSTAKDALKEVRKWTARSTPKSQSSETAKRKRKKRG